MGINTLRWKIPPYHSFQNYEKFIHFDPMPEWYVPISHGIDMIFSEFDRTHQRLQNDTKFWRELLCASNFLLPILSKIKNKWIFLSAFWSTNNTRIQSEFSAFIFLYLYFFVFLVVNLKIFSLSYFFQKLKT